MALLLLFAIVSFVKSTTISENDVIGVADRQLKCFKCDKRRSGFENDEWFYKCLYPHVGDIGHEFNGTMMLEDCWSVSGGRCWVKVDTLKSEKGSRYDVQHISRGCETAEEEEATDYCAISTNAANVITQKNCLSHCDNNYCKSGASSGPVSVLMPIMGMLLLLQIM